MRCFSNFSVETGGETTDTHSAKANELIAFLACERGSVSKRRAAETLWADSPPEKAIKSLYQTLRHLRTLDFPAPPIVSETRGALRLAAATDTADFLRLYESGAPEDWERAVVLYRGILLVDNCYDWASEYEGYYDVRYYELLSRLAAHYASAGNKNLARYYKNRLNE
ncbi:MAG: hypothetical protein LBU36_00185 [Clostridiales bacterium]|nr:hypothetical protein [Clostridiales bacterium]